MIFDCFPFFNELDILEIRLHELEFVVDNFVLVEATKTHSGLDKPLYFSENKERFKRFLPKIIHIIVDDMPMTREQVSAAISPQDRKWLDTGYQLGDNWVRERFQRNAIILDGVNSIDINKLPERKRDIPPPYCFMHFGWQTDEETNAHVEYYRRTGLIEGMKHPRVFGGDIKLVEEWMVEN